MKRVFVSNTAAALLLTLMLAAACGPPREEAQRAFADAQEDMRKLEEDKPTSAESLLVRTLLKKAERAMADEDYQQVIDTSRQASQEAQKILRTRAQTNKFLAERLEAAKQKFFSVAYPRPALVNSYFNAQAAHARKDYVTATQELNAFEANYKLDRAMETEAEVELRFPPGSAAEDDQISVFSELTATGKLLNRIAQLPNNSKVKFIQSVWLDRDVRFIRIGFMVRGKKYEGWVESKFLAQ